MIGILPIIGIGIGPVWSFFGWDRSDYQSTASGPTRREASSRYEGRFSVDKPEIKRLLELTPRIRGEQAPSQAVHLKFEVQSPTGEILAQGEQDLAPGKGFRWSTLRAEFQPHEEGDHVLILEMPAPVGRVDIVVKELRKGLFER
jgi:hypothetical protein